MTRRDRPQIITTAGDLAAVAASVAAGTPVFVDPDEVEPGADPRNPDTWAVVASTIAVPVNDDGELAKPGEAIGIHERIEADGSVTRHLASTPVLSLRGRHLAVAGEVGPTAVPADPDQRRSEALDDPDGDIGRYLMELADAVTGLDEEITGVHAGQPFAPPVRRRLLTAQTHLAAALEQIRDATRFGQSCGLVEQGIVDDDQPCAPADLTDTVFVDIPRLHYDEGGCPAHAALLLTTEPGTSITKARRPEARHALRQLLPDLPLPPADEPPPTDHQR
ncbi:hypothetical protein [Actinoplanes sp. G11-F43]|uniref:hypothetical protein n=1 Tax=Actinoplanes sp. G11-F43 TaxID=3424130 RepID=UPI003D34CD53